MITTLLSLALSLLIAAQQPNVPIELKNEAVKVATYAIQVATHSIQTPTVIPTKIDNNFGTVIPPEMPSCVESPILTLIPSTTTYDRNTGTTVSFTGIYSTGCLIDPTINWSFVGVPDAYGAIRGSISFQGDVPGKEIYNKILFYGQSGSFISTSTTFTLTVGDTSRSVTVK